MLEPQYFGGEHFLFTAIAAAVLMGAFLTVSLVMFWAPGRKKTWEEVSEAAVSEAPSDESEDTAEGL